MHQYAYTGKGHTIHSRGQWEMYKNKGDDHSRVVGGTQSITILDGYQIHMSIHKGLPYFALRPPTDEEIDKYPHVVVTNDDVWDPECLDAPLNTNLIETTQPYGAYLFSPTALNLADKIKRHHVLKGEESPNLAPLTEIVRSGDPLFNSDDFSTYVMHNFSPSNLIGQTILKFFLDDDTCHRAHITQQTNKFYDILESNL